MATKKYDGPPPTHSFERPPKSRPKDVIDYEIAMMEHCCNRTLVSKHPLSRDDLAFLEAFLFHFRILLEFFGEPGRYPDNLHFQKPETCGVQVSKDALAAVAAQAHTMENQWGQKLNKFLAHPTERRYTAPRSWPIYQMRTEMRQLVRLLAQPAAAALVAGRSGALS